MLTLDFQIALIKMRSNIVQDICENKLNFLKSHPFNAVIQEISLIEEL